MTFALVAAADSSPSDRKRSAGASGRRQLDPQTLGQHVDRLYRAALFMCGSPEEAEDLVQDTFARVLRRPRMLHSDDDLGYLLRVLRNTCISARRTAARRPETVAMAEEAGLPEARAAAEADARLELVELYGAIAALPSMSRDVLVAIDVMGLSYREAAHALGVAEATVTTRLHRARQRLARSLEI
jgi:RNA polymerase sigma-70 factor (ECF subfamily)